jgi:hypothetical protein
MPGQQPGQVTRALVEVEWVHRGGLDAEPHLPVTRFGRWQVPYFRNFHAAEDADDQSAHGIPGR